VLKQTIENFCKPQSCVQRASDILLKMRHRVRLHFRRTRKFTHTFHWHPETSHAVSIYRLGRNFQFCCTNVNGAEGTFFAEAPAMRGTLRSFLVDCLRRALRRVQKDLATGDDSFRLIGEQWALAETPTQRDWLRHTNKRKPEP
jgi:hypothetical protein